MNYKAGNATDVCGYCSKPYHDESNCLTKQRDMAGGSCGGPGVGTGSGSRGTGGRKKFDGCAICGSEGHWKNECPEIGTSKDRSSSGNRGGGQEGIPES